MEHAFIPQSPHPPLAARVPRLATEIAAVANIGTPAATSDALAMIGEWLGVPACALWTVTARGDKVVCRRVWVHDSATESGRELAMLTLGLALPAGYGLPGRALAAGDGAVLGGAADFALPRRSAAATAGLTHGCAVPMRRDGKVGGVLEVFASAQDGPLDEAATALTELARRVAPVLL